MKNYYPLYECRVCGSIFRGSYPIEQVYGISNEVERYQFGLGRFDTHICVKNKDDGTANVAGLGEFIGFTEENYIKADDGFADPDERKAGC